MRNDKVSNLLEISLSNEDIASDLLLSLRDEILDGNLSLKINLPTKTVFVSAYDHNNVLIRAEEV